MRWPWNAYWALKLGCLDHDSLVGMVTRWVSAGWFALSLLEESLLKQLKSGESNRSLTPLLLESITIHLPSPSRYFAKVCLPPGKILIFFTPPIYIMILLPFISRCFCRSIRVRGRWNAPYKDSDLWCIFWGSCQLTNPVVYLSTVFFQPWTSVKRVCLLGRLWEQCSLLQRARRSFPSKCLPEDPGVAWPLHPDITYFPTWKKILPGTYWWKDIWFLGWFLVEVPSRVVCVFMWFQKPSSFSAIVCDSVLRM